jgi:NAD(P)-dependent dehydrogenase (short-subunit alcohol dehydrogenase family)
MARALAAQGCAVAIQDIELDVAKAQADRIAQDGGRAIALGGDIGNLDGLPGLVDATIGQLGGIHILINNAAIQHEKDWLDETPDGLLRVWRANVIAPLRLCQLCVPAFRAQRWGRIVNVGSIQQRGGNAHMLPYAMSKAALENMTKALGRSLAKEGITANLIAPGYFNTWRNREAFQTPEDVARAGKFVPLGRAGEPEDAGGLAVLLCSDAGAYITGQSIFLDGGMSAR